jgi:molybdopterin-guanine dinucleotide biosynthesis protein A
MSNDASAIILAGGQSRRMGRPKAALPFGDATLLDRLIAELVPNFAEVIVVAAPRGGAALTVETIVARWDEQVTLLHDEAAFAGPVPALLRGLRAAHQATVFVCSCDLPLLRAQVADRLCLLSAGFDAAIPVIAGRSQPLCAAYRRGAAERLEALARAGESRLTTITARLAVRRVAAAELYLADPDLRSFLNVNTPEDYARALALAGF